MEKVAIEAAPAQLDYDREAFEQMLRKLGGRSGNATLRRELGWDDARYWNVHGELFEEGKIVKGRGKGGSVAFADIEKEPAEPARRREADLYEPARRVIASSWVKSKNYDEAIVEITGLAGRRQTGGTWTRPDITVAAIKSYEYFPDSVFDIVTFEIKPRDAVGVLGVFEAMSHREFATRAYLLFCVEEENFEDTPEAERIEAIAKSYGVGLIIANDVQDFDTWDERLEAQRTNPDPGQVDLFIRTNLSAESKTRIIKWQK